MSTIADSYAFNADTSLIAQWKQLGRKIYRHSGNAGSVVEFDYWGTPMKLFVADAKYRGLNLKYDRTPRLHGNPKLDASNGFFSDDPPDSDTAPLSYTRDDVWIQSRHAILRNDGTAKSNTDKLMAYSSTEAAHHCRNQNISGVGQLDLPNLYELIILYFESDNIDALDPTVESNRDNALGMMNTEGRFDFGYDGAAWSSTECSSSKACNVGSSGYTGSRDQDMSCAAIPVKEL